MHAGARRPHGVLGRLTFIVPLVLLAAGCGPPVDLKASLLVEDASSGWYDEGIVDGKNKLVPTVAFVLKNVSSRTVSSVQLNVVFRRVGDPDEWDASFLRGIDADGLAAGAKTPRLTIRAKLGYTGEQPRADMLQHSQFVDARVKIFAKHGSAQWVELGDFPIERLLLTSQ